MLVLLRAKGYNYPQYYQKKKQKKDKQNTSRCVLLCSSWLCQLMSMLACVHVLWISLHLKIEHGLLPDLEVPLFLHLVTLNPSKLSPTAVWHVFVTSTNMNAHENSSFSHHPPDRRTSEIDLMRLVRSICAAVGELVSEQTDRSIKATWDIDSEPRLHSDQQRCFWHQSEKGHLSFGTALENPSLWLILWLFEQTKQRNNVDILMYLECGI